MTRLFFVTLLCLGMVVGIQPSYGDGLSSFKKNRIKQLSKKSDRYNYYEEKNNRVKKGSKKTGLDATRLKGYGKVQNWVEIDNSKVGNVVSSAAKRFRPKKSVKGKNRKNVPDRNLGVIANCNSAGSIDNTVIVKRSKVENAILGGTVNSGIIVDNCRGRIQGKKYSNNVVVEKSRVGGAAGVLNR